MVRLGNKTNHHISRFIALTRSSSHLVCMWYEHLNDNTGCPNKKETGTNMPISLKCDRHLNNFGYYLVGGYLLFPTVPRNVHVGSITSVNEHEVDYFDFVPNPLKPTAYYCASRFEMPAHFMM